MGEESKDLTAPLELTVVLKSCPVKLTQDDGTVKEYVLKELLGRGRNEYLSQIQSRVRTDKAGNPIGLKSYKGMQAELLTRCLYNESGELVEAEEVEEYPASTQQALFLRAQKLSGLGMEQEDDEGKND